MSDVSNNYLLKKSDRILMESQSDKIPDIVKLKPMKRGVNDSRNVKALPNHDMQENLRVKI